MIKKLFISAAILTALISAKESRAADAAACFPLAGFVPAAHMPTGYSPNL
jgi:hypothetical protein